MTKFFMLAFCGLAVTEGASMFDQWGKEQELADRLLQVTCSQTEFLVTSDLLPQIEGCHEQTTTIFNDAEVYTPSGTIAAGSFIFSTTDDVWALATGETNTNNTILCTSVEFASEFTPADVTTWFCTGNEEVEIECGCGPTDSPTPAPTVEIQDDDSAGLGVEEGTNGSASVLGSTSVATVVGVVSMTVGMFFVGL